jgi:hypothetical protein
VSARGQAAAPAAPLAGTSPHYGGGSVLRCARVTATSSASEAREAPPAPDERERSGDESFERPAFAEAFPRTPELDALVEAFERGDHARVRTDAPKLAERSDDPRVAAAARELRARLDPDPIAYVLLGLPFLLLVFLSAWFLWHAHP